MIGTVVLGASGAALGPAWATLTGVVRLVLQKDRHYRPADLFLRRGDTITFQNGDTDVNHHPFIEANRFSFDAGDQEPGAMTHLTLAEPGDFVIQCGIHPKMKLTIHVQ